MDDRKVQKNPVIDCYIPLSEPFQINSACVSSSAGKTATETNNMFCFKRGNNDQNSNMPVFFFCTLKEE
jgi:hypothetical protein